MNGPIFFSVSRLRHVLLHSSRLANLLLLPPHPPYTNSTHWPDDSSKRQRLKYAWHGPESSTRTHTAAGGSGRVTQRYKSLFNNNKTSVAVALKSSGTQAQKRNKTKSLIIFSRAGNGRESTSDWGAEDYLRWTGNFEKIRFEIFTERSKTSTRF